MDSTARRATSPDGLGERSNLAALERFSDAHVFVIDDNPTNIELLRALLLRAGLRAVSSSTDPREAVRRLDDMVPDLVLLDLHMPQLDGYSVLQRIVERAAGSYLPVMVLTADDRPEALEKALSLGARDFVTKPFNATEVILRVRNLLETRYLHVTLRQHNVELRAELGGYREVERAEREAIEAERLRIERVISDRQLQIVFQPVVDLATGELVGVEALSRFPADPSRGPDRWFAAASQAGLGVDLALGAVDAALGALPRLPDGAFLAVNMSPATLVADQATDLVSPDVAPRVVVELTEHVPVEDYDTVNAAAERLRSRGARVAIDDTGAGYAGFRHLISLKPDIVKLDICLTRGVDQDPGRRALTSALVQFTQDTGATLIAEGVETGEELDTLHQLRVDWAQGYHLGRPQPLADVLAHQARRASSGVNQILCGRSAT
jgi:EAL domain-containing protein (putative c-di-GMP-specific phosphodiesterase class I)/AmiR/NasT family two-component response regulator